MAASPDIGSCLSEGWELYKRRPGLLTGATIIAALVNAIAEAVPFATLITYPLTLAGLYIIVIRLDAGEDVRLANLLDGLPKFLPLVLASLLMSLLITLGLLLLVLPGLYLAFAYGFTTLNIVDRDLDFWPAMEASRRTITAHFWTYLGFAIILLFIVLAGALALGVGVLVAIPVCIAAQYRFYRTLHPLDEAAAPSQLA